MRKLKIEWGKSHNFVIDWNFKKWTLINNTDGSISCSELMNSSFKGIEVFCLLLYGAEFITDKKGDIIFRNYELEINQINK